MPRCKKTQTVEENLKTPIDSVVSSADSVMLSDLLPGEGFPWKRVLPTVHRITQAFGYQRVETSPVEELDVFSDFQTILKSKPERFLRVEGAGGKKFALRPQNFLSVLRAYKAHQVYEKEKTTKWYYIEPTFAPNNPSLLDGYEFGVVNFGEPTAISDAQMIAMIKVLLEEFGISNVVFEINSKGCDGCAAYYHEVLSDFLQQNKYELCPTCQKLLSKDSAPPSGFLDNGLYEVFRCKNGECRELLGNAPQIIDYLDTYCNRHLTSLLESLDELEIPYQLNPVLFGNGQLSHTLFQIKVLPSSGGAEEEILLGVGGRHNRFVSKLIGQDIPAVLFSIPLQKIFMVLDSHGKEQKNGQEADVFLISVGESAAKKSLKLFLDLWKRNIKVAERFGENGIKNQFKLAEKKGCRIALIVGQKEALESSVILRDVRSGIQEVFSYERAIEEVKKRLQE